jgi:hypothetical protein
MPMIKPLNLIARALLFDMDGNFAACGYDAD